MLVPVVGAQVNKFEQFSSDGHQMSLGGQGQTLCLMSRGAGAVGGWRVVEGWDQGWIVPCLMSGDRARTGELGLGNLYSDVQCIMGNNYIWTPCEQNDRQT